MSTPPILLGQSEFTLLREDEGLYIDKTGFVSSVLAPGPLVQLFPRPRRFGKTLNMTTLRAWLEPGPDRSALFADLSVWQDPHARRYFQKHPVVWLSFKDVKQRSWDQALSNIVGMLQHELRRHPELRDSARVEPGLKAQLDAMHEGVVDSGRALLNLTEALAQHHQTRVVVLIDEYDAPLLSAWEHGYFDDAIAWFRSFLSGGLKDNPQLLRGVLTGILRVAKESMFSGLNNIVVRSILSADIAEPFGFTESEIGALLRQYDRETEASELRAWYNGYRFGQQTIYNPWSILHFFSFPTEPCQPWWLNTSDNALVRRLLLESEDLEQDFATLLRGGTLERPIEENITLRDLRGDRLWSLLLFSGYLRADSVRVEEGLVYATLAVPNLEVRTLWRGTFSQWLRDQAGRTEPLHKALLAGDGPEVQALLSEMLARHASVHDVARTQDEVFYHAFVLGLLVSLEKTHVVRPNRESGRGRADVLISPRHPGTPGLALEFKRQRSGLTLNQCAQQAWEQAQRRDYAAELRAAGAEPAHVLGVAFAGKEVAVYPG